MSTAVSIRGLRVSRGGKLALPGIDLDVPPGSVTGLLGPSGSGKTTLMRAIVGVQVVERGDVSVLGLPAGSPELRRRVGYVTQAPSVYADLTVRENLDVLRSYRRGRKRPGRSGHRPCGARGHEQVAGALSGGQLARVSLATALLNEPELLVLDEPTVGLDRLPRPPGVVGEAPPARRDDAVVERTEFHRRAERCDRLVLLREGTVLAVETPDALREGTGASGLDEAFRASSRAARPSPPPRVSSPSSAATRARSRC